MLRSQHLIATIRMADTRRCMAQHGGVQLACAAAKMLVRARAHGCVHVCVYAWWSRCQGGASRRALNCGARVSDLAVWIPVSMLTRTHSPLGMAWPGQPPARVPRCGVTDQPKPAHTCTRFSQHIQRGQASNLSAAAHHAEAFSAQRQAQNAPRGQANHAAYGSAWLTRPGHSTLTAVRSHLVK